MATESHELNGHYPFCAVVGQDNVKRALLCALIDPSISSVLVVGAAGTAKTTIVRSLTEICPSARTITLPLNVTEERLIGGVDIEAAIRDGKSVRDPGVLEKANGNILLVDQVNLFDESIVQMALSSAEEGHFHVDCEGLTTCIESRFLLIGTMDPREGGLSSHILDRFELCAFTDDIEDQGERAEIIRRRIDYESSTFSFQGRYQQETEQIRNLIMTAKDRLPYVLCSEGHFETISRLCLDLGVEGHRGDIAMAKVSKCIASLGMRENVIADDLQNAAEICLQHRRKDVSRSDERSGKDPKEQEKSPDASPGSLDDNSVDTGVTDRPADHTNDYEMHSSGGQNQEETFDIGDPFAIIQFLKDDERLKTEKRKRGRRGSVISADRSGRYVSYRLPNGKCRDIAFDATIRAAAPFQRGREKNGRSFVIRPSDIREKVRVRKSGTTILFLVDASGSMGARRRMVTVKGAILSMLKDAYQKRDMVGLMTFSNGSSELILPPTKSVDLAYTKLRSVPTGGKTPLPLALSKAAEFLCSPRMRGAHDVALVIITDGHANVAVRDGDAFSQTLNIAHQMSTMPIQYVVVDSETGYPRIGKASRLSEALGGSYFKLEGLNADEIASSLKAVVHGTVGA
jgi:magnesium chelatase subunit D